MSGTAVDMTELRERVAKACRVLGKLDLTNHILGHVSMRVPGTDTVLIRARGPAQSGVRFTKAKDVITVDLNGRKVEGTAGLDAPNEVFIHTWLYRTRPEVNAVLHAHPATTVLFTCCDKPLLPLYGAYDPGSLRLVRDGIPMFPRSVLVADDAIGEEFAATFKQGRACLMYGHGITTCGASPEEVTLTAISLNNLAEMNYRAHVLGGAKAIPPEDMEALSNLAENRGKEARDTPIWRYYCELLGEEP
ncbi:MAG: Methylthioribulose-phosphate dehydratase [Noviherbaspirillum sp.]|jgi:ribulose-5-phosphate 4-epimerase/fuculose-1-phosphate aldolase|nr:Methylthioribulose-phosphate dehydratase [Noviherbaspirillum sp.]